LVLGYGAIDEHAIRDGVEILASIYQEQQASHPLSQRKDR
jgi:hypothetical protein